MNKLLTSFFIMLTCILPTVALKADVLQLTDKNFNEVVNSSKPVVVDVYTDWCGPCKNLAPIFNELNNEIGNKYLFVKLNAEQQTKIADFFKISAYPTIIFIKNGKETGRIMGFRTKPALIKEIENYLSK